MQLKTWKQKLNQKNKRSTVLIGLENKHCSLLARDQQMQLRSPAPHIGLCLLGPLVQADGPCLVQTIILAMRIQIWPLVQIWPGSVKDTWGNCNGSPASHANQALGAARDFQGLPTCLIWRERVHGKSHPSRAVQIWMTTESSEQKNSCISHPTRARPICPWQWKPGRQRICEKNFGFFPNSNRARVTLLGWSGTLQIVLGVLYLCPQGPRG